MAYDLERVVPVAAEIWQRTARAETRATLHRAFKREITVNDVWTEWVLDEMGISPRRFSNEPYIPTGVLVLGGKDLPSEAVLDDFLAREGTVIVEGKYIDDASSGVETHAKKTPQGVVPVAGAATSGLLPDAITPCIWASTDARAVRFAPAREAPVLLATADRVPLVQRMTTRGGTLVHVAWVIGDLRMGKRESEWAPGISPKMLAKRVGLDPTGTLSSDEAMPEQELCAALTMIAHFADLVASALTGSSTAQPQ
jgi:hypothetical protein